MKVTNTDHTAINDNHSKCQMTKNAFDLQQRFSTFAFEK